MLKKTIRRLGALAMVLAMAVSVFAVNASATGKVTPPTPTITKNISKEADVYLPNATFTFKAEADGHSSDTKYGTPSAEEALGATKEGVLGTITSEPKDSDLIATTVEVGKLTINVKKDAFAGPGTYYYTITETGSYDGMKYDSAPRTFIVMIGANGDVLSYGFINSKEDHTKNKGVFTNIYMDDGEDHKGPHDLILKKNVTGNAYDAGMTYDFWVTIKNANTNVEEWYNVVRTDGTTEKIVAGARNKITLRKDESVTIKGLSPNDTYIVEEADYTTEAYKYSAPTATKKIGNETASLELKKTEGTDAEGKGTGVYTFKSGIVTMTTEDNTVEVTNNKDFATPGGVIMTIAPYALMVVLAGAFAVVFLTRRNRAE